MFCLAERFFLLVFRWTMFPCLPLCVCVCVTRVFLSCPVCRIASCPSRSVSDSKRRPGCWRGSSILTLSASTTPGRDRAKERNVLFWSPSSWHLELLKRESPRKTFHTHKSAGTSLIWSSISVWDEFLWNASKFHLRVVLIVFFFWSSHNSCFIQLHSVTFNAKSDL